MRNDIEALRADIAILQQQLDVLERETGEKREQYSSESTGNQDPLTLQQQKLMRIPTLRYMANLPLRIHLSGPFVYGMIVPIVFLDLCLIIFQAICFRLWRIPRLHRSDYIVVDRHKLAYLNGLEKLNCIFCGYANGVFSFAIELAARTEHYWCPIKHASKITHPHNLYEEFLDFGDASSWQNHPSRKHPKRACEDCLQNHR